MAIHPNSLANLRPLMGKGRPKGSKNRKLTVENLAEEIRRIAFQDPLDFFIQHGAKKIRKGVYQLSLREVQDMRPEARACIASMKIKTENLTAGDDRQDTIVEIKLWNKIDALTLAAKHFKWIDDRAQVNVNLDEEILSRLDRGRARNALAQAVSQAVDATTTRAALPAGEPDEDG